jgi:tetratricopeptide (TPR) repeat protein
LEKTLNTSPTPATPYNTYFHEDLSHGNWEELYKTAAEWLRIEPAQPIATFILNIACLFINPPAIIQNKQYLESVPNKDWKAVLSWFSEFQGVSDQDNPYFQAIDFILQPPSKKKNSIEKALEENPNNPELLFLQAIALRDRNTSIEKLKQAAKNKPEFPACLYLLGIFSLQLNQVEAAEAYLKQAVKQAPNFLEAHYQLGSLYTLYIPNSTEQSTLHFERVIELDPQGGAGKDAKLVLETHSKPQYGQRIGGDTSGRRGGMSILTILGISLLTVVLFSGPIASLFKITSPMIGILAGMFVFIGLYSAMGRKK